MSAALRCLGGALIYVPALPLPIGNITHPGTSCTAAVPNLRVIDLGLCHRVRRALRDTQSAFNFGLGPIMLEKGCRVDRVHLFNDTCTFSTNGPAPSCASSSVCRSVLDAKEKQNSRVSPWLQVTSPRQPN